MGRHSQPAPRKEEPPYNPFELFFFYLFVIVFASLGVWRVILEFMY